MSQAPVPRPHPFKVWADLKELTLSEIEGMCRAGGYDTTSAAYLHQIVTGHRRPGYDFSKFLSSTITGGAVSVAEFMEFPPKKKSAVTPAKRAASRTSSNRVSRTRS